jgi:putative DNA primase/helicase
MIGKRVGVFPDVRLRPARTFGSTGFDPGGLDYASAELLLKVIAADRLSLGRKYLGPWEGKLKLKAVLNSNDIPNFNDAVLPGRFVKARWGVSFLGREDVELKGKLKAELPGIAVRCVRAYQRLSGRGYFVQPASAEGLEREVVRVSDPFAAVVHECFEVDPKGVVGKTEAYARFVRRCEEMGRHDLVRECSTAQVFGPRLRAVSGFGQVNDAPRPHGQPRAWGGMRLKEAEQKVVKLKVVPLLGIMRR